MAEGRPEWELSKENVQPLKQGREMGSLSAALQHSASDAARLQSERQEYEVQLRMYSGDDPLAVWDEYIKWTEQNFPTGGKDSHLATLLERCVVHFQDSEELKNDSRLVNVWIKVANACTEPLNIFTYMYDHEIGCKLAFFYVTWAGVLESMGDTKKADAVFEMGMKSCAEPEDLLQRRHREFQMRITRLTMTGQLPTQQEEENPSSKPRRALGTLTGKKGAVSSIRKASSSSVKLSAAPPSANRAGSAFSVCQDENAFPSSLLPPQTGEYASVPVQSTTNRENKQKAGVWTNASARQKTRAPAESEINVYTEEMSKEQAMMTPMKSNPCLQPQLLSERKVKPTNFLQNFEQATAADSKSVPMYCKDLIYGGVTEMTFEELRAQVYYEKKKKENEQAQMYTSMKDKLREELRLELEAQMAEKFKKQLEEQQTLIKSLSKVEIREQASAESANKRPLGEDTEDVPHKKHTSSSAASSFLSDPPSTSLNSLSVRSDPPSADYSSNLKRLGSSFADRNASVSGQSNVSVTNRSSGLTSSFQTPDHLQVNASSSISRCDPPSRNASSIEGRSNPSISDYHSSLNLSKAACPASVERSMSTSHHSDNQNGSRCNLFGQKQLPQQQLHQANISSTGQSNSSCRTPDPAVSFNLSTRHERPHSANASQMTPSGHSGLFNMTGSHGRLPSADPTPDTSVSGRLGFGGKVSLTAPSPTVNTKAALLAVQSMFNRSLNTNDVAGDFGWDNKHGANDDSDDDDGLSQFANKTGVATGAPQSLSLGGFQIYDENAACDDKPQASDAVDKENEGFPTDKPAHKPVGAILKSRIPLQPKKMPVAEPDASSDEEMDHQASCPQPQQMVIPYVDENLMDQENAHSAGAGFKGYSLSPKTYTMPMPGDDEEEAHPCFDDMGDMTFTPNCMSTRIFHPPSMQMAASSTTFRQSIVVGSIAPIEHLDDDTVPPPKTPKTPTESTSTEQTPGTTVNRTAPSFNDETNATRADRTEKGLSPIIETSNEDTRSTANGSSTLDHHSSLSATQGPHHTTANGQALKPMSPINEPSHESLFEKTCHEIDVSAYVPSSPRREDLEKSVMINPMDPFDEEEIAKFLAVLDEPLEYSPNYRESRDPMPGFRSDGFYVMGDDQIKVVECVGKGAFGQVFKIALIKDDVCDDDDDDIKETKVIKIQKPACPWELYITNELHRRLAIAIVKGVRDVRSSIMTIDRGYFFTDGSCLLYDFYKYGTLLNIANMYKKNRMKMPEVFILYITCELLAITEAMIECNIIHGDVKPDNFLFRGLPDLKDVPDSEVFNGSSKALMMIDFGRSIDLNFYPSGTTFTNKVNTSCFMCTEMMTSRPWTFQTDLFGLAGTVFLLMFLDYMKVYQEKGSWKTTGNFRRQWQFGDLWLKFFNTMLNIDDCDDLPDLRELRMEFQRVFLTQKKTYLFNLPQLELQLYKM